LILLSYTIAIDAFRLECEPFTSGAFYVNEMCFALADKDAVKKILLLIPSEINATSYEWLRHHPKIEFIRHFKAINPTKNFISNVKWIQFIIPQLLKARGVDFFIGPYHQIPIFLKKANKVVVIHDVCGLKKEAGYKFYKLAFWKHLFNFFTVLISKCSVIYISFHTKQDFEKVFGFLSKKKSVVIYNSSSKYKSKYSESLPDLPSEYLLGFAFQGIRKGSFMLHDAYKKYLEFGGKSSLVLITSGHDRTEISKMFKEFGDKIKIFCSLSDGELNFIYKNASQFLFLSICEGFGYPIVESIFQGTPVLAWSNTPAVELLPENYPGLFDKYEAGEILSRIQHFENISDEENDYWNLKATKILDNFSSIKYADHFIDFLSSHG
jgi:hypothetical protein